jgi:hypothetical protein
MKLENTPQGILSYNDRPLHMTSQKKPQKGWYMKFPYHSSCKYCLDGDSTCSKVRIDKTEVQEMIWVE